MWIKVWVTKVNFLWVADRSTVMWGIRSTLAKVWVEIKLDEKGSQDSIKWNLWWSRGGAFAVHRSLGMACLPAKSSDVRWRRCTNGGLYVGRPACASLLLVLLLVHSSTAEKSEVIMYKGLQRALLIGNNNEKYPWLKVLLGLKCTYLHDYRAAQWVSGPPAVWLSMSF